MKFSRHRKGTSKFPAPCSEATEKCRKQTEGMAPLGYSDLVLRKVSLSPLSLRLGGSTFLSHQDWSLFSLGASE